MVHKSWLKKFHLYRHFRFTHFEYQLLTSTNLSIFHFGIAN